MSKLQTKCDHCGEQVILLRNRYKPDYLDGFCLKCGKRTVRRMYKCRNCEAYTQHKFSRTNKEKETMIWTCEHCGTERSIYIGLRRSPERSMMSTGAGY